MRDTDISRAYFQCHTDITIPSANFSQISLYSSSFRNTLVTCSSPFVPASNGEVNTSPTCYSHAENVRVYNQDGKEIIAKDNEVSALRDTDIGRAYFQCHTECLLLKIIL